MYIFINYLEFLLNWPALPSFCLSSGLNMIKNINKLSSNIDQSLWSSFPPSVPSSACLLLVIVKSWVDLKI